MGIKISQLTPKGSNLASTDLIEISELSGSTYISKSITGQQIMNAASAGLTVGTTAITSGTNGRILFQAGGVLQQDAAFFWDNTNKRLGIGATPSTSVRLDVRAQGTLSTDIAFRIRNSADTANLFNVNGDGTHFFFNSTGSTNINFYQYGHGIWANGGSSFRIKNLNGSTNIEATTSTRFITDVTNKAITFDGRQLHIGGQSLPTINGDSCIIIESGTAPTTVLSDRFYIYSADITAGNAAPHFRTENGNIVKIYQETTAVAAATLVGGGGTALTSTDTFDGYTLQQIVKALRNTGLLA